MTESPRLYIVQEYLWMQGFPIEHIKEIKGDFHDSVLTGLAGNMCSTPVFLSVLCAAIASVDWDRCKEVIQRSKVESIEPVKQQPSLKQSFFYTRYGPPKPPGNYLT